MGYSISFVGTMDISLYTLSEQPRVAGTRLAKNGYAAATHTATMLCKFMVDWQSLPRSLDNLIAVK